MGKAIRILIKYCEFKSHWEAILLFYFYKPSVSILYRNVRFVLKTKNPNNPTSQVVSPPTDCRSFNEPHVRMTEPINITNFLYIAQINIRI